MRCARPATAEALAWVAAMALVGCGSTAPVSQPIDFSHQRHLEADIGCSTCHEKVADAPAATLPPLRVCAKCHKALKGKDVAREQPIVDAVGRKRELDWVQVNRLPGHVYFSHRVHVGFAEMDCAVCHGDMKAQDHALVSSNIGSLTMSACIDCHAQKGASRDCAACHK